MSKEAAGSSSPLSSITGSPPSGSPPSLSPPKAQPANDDVGLSLPPEKHTEAASSRPKRSKRRVIVKNTPRKSKWNAENILTDTKSPLASADLRSILSSPRAWDVLEAEEKAEILALFPDDQHILSVGAPDARPDFASLMNDDSFRYDCAAYTENVAQGRHDPEWLASAWSAYERRKMGDFDEYLESKFQEDWDAEVREEMRPKRRQTQAPETPAAEAETNEPETTKENDTTIVNDVDELQVNNGKNQTKIKSIIARHPMKMDIDGAKSDDELA